MGTEKSLKAQISAKGMQISVVSDGGYDDYISLTDIARYKSEDPAAHLRIRILPLNLPHGFLRNLSYILSPIIRGLRQMKTVGFLLTGT